MDLVLKITNNLFMLIDNLTSLFILVLSLNILRISINKYKNTNEYKLKKYFQEIALNPNGIQKENYNNEYILYYIRNSFLKKTSKNKFIITEKGLDFLKIIYNENNNITITYMAVVSLALSVTTFMTTFSKQLQQLINSIFNIFN